MQWGRVGYPRRAPMLRVSTSGLIAVKSSKIASHSALVNAEGYDSCRRGNRVGTARKNHVRDGYHNARDDDVLP